MNSSDKSSHVRNVRLLYKLILRLHRGLPEEIQTLGTKYAQDEFRRHKQCSPTQAVVFMQEWTNYAIMLANQLKVKGKAPELGNQLSETHLDTLRDEQIMQLYELMRATKQ